jgi:hypothetical protein
MVADPSKDSAAPVILAWGRFAVGPHSCQISVFNSLFEGTPVLGAVLHDLDLREALEGRIKCQPEA